MNKSRKFFLILIITLISITVVITGIIIFYMLNQKQGNKDTNQEDNNENNNIVADISNNNKNENISETAEKMAIDTFNTLFEIYEGTEVSGSQIKSLIAAVETNNSSRTDNHLVEFSKRGITSNQEVNTSKNYTVSIEYDEEGYVSVIEINENIGESGNQEYTEGDMEKLLFNSKLMPYIGEITGKQLSILLDMAKESNDNNSNHQILLASNNLKDLNGIQNEFIYDITFKYDDNGYIKIIIIDFNESRTQEEKEKQEQLNSGDVEQNG